MGWVLRDRYNAGEKQRNSRAGFLIPIFWFP